MTRTRNGGFVVGQYLRLPVYDDPGTSDAAGTGAAPDDQAEPTQQPSDGAQGDETGEGSPPAEPDPSSSPAGQSSAGDNTDGDDEPGRIKQLSDEAAKYRNRAKAAEDRADQADATIKALRIENAFIRHALPLVDDVTAAWKLADHSLVTVDDDGNVTGMKELVQSVIRNYPYLERQPDTQPMRLPGSGGTPANGRRNDTDVASRAALAKKYPALRSR